HIQVPLETSLRLQVLARFRPIEKLRTRIGHRPDREIREALRSRHDRPITGVSVDVMNRTRQCRMAPERAAALHENLPLLDSVKVRVHDGVAELSDGIDLGLHRVGRYGLFELPD